MSEKCFRTSEASEFLINKHNIPYGQNILKKKNHWIQNKIQIINERPKKIQQTSKVSEDLINKQTLIIMIIFYF